MLRILFAVAGGGPVGAGFSAAAARGHDEGHSLVRGGKEIFLSLE